MKPKNFIVCARGLAALFGMLACSVRAWAGIDLSGAIRNDAMIYGLGEETLFINILENKLLLQRQTPAWRFYSDLRIRLYYGEGVEAPAGWPEELEWVNASLLRAFVRTYSPVGDFSLGKTYVNFGMMGPFNLFEVDPTVNFSDLNYTKEGIIALTYEAPWGELGGVKAYVSPQGQDTDVSGGASAYTHWGAFDVGLVAGRIGRDRNFTGLYFKGDAEVEVQAAGAVWADDVWGDYHAQAMAGVDYSFLDTQLLAGVQYLYNDGPDDASRDTTTPTFSTSGVTGFTDRHYVYANLAYVPDEFFQVRVDAFINAQDRSALVVPSATWVLADGLNITALAGLPTDRGDTQFSSMTLGDYAAVLRLEAVL